MDFAVSEKMQVILEMITEFVEKELIPLEAEYLNREFVDLLPVLTEKRRMVRRMELWAPNQPRELGGMGLDLVCTFPEAFGPVSVFSGAGNGSLQEPSLFRPLPRAAMLMVLSCAALLMLSALERPCEVPYCP